MLGLKRSAGVAPEGNLRNPLHADSGAGKHGSTQILKARAEVQNSGISSPTKRTDALQFFQKKRVLSSSVSVTPDHSF